PAHGQAGGCIATAWLQRCDRDQLEQVIGGGQPLDLLFSITGENVAGGLVLSARHTLEANSKSGWGCTRTISFSARLAWSMAARVRAAPEASEFAIAMRLKRLRAVTKCS